MKKTEMTPGEIRRNLELAQQGNTIAVITSNRPNAAYLFKAHLGAVNEWNAVSAHVHNLRLVFPGDGTITFKYMPDQIQGRRFDYVEFDGLADIPPELIELATLAAVPRRTEDDAT